MTGRIMGLALCGVLCGCGSVEKPDPGVKASSFGWDAEDSTKCLQAAFDSGAKKIVIDRQAGDWYCGQIFLRSNQQVVLEDGVTVRAKQGAFKNPDHKLFNLLDCTNTVLRGEGRALIRMERDEYTDRSRYKFSEWRHTVFVGRSKNIMVRDLEIAFSGGDGIYVYGSEDVTVQDIDTHDHYRLAACSTGGTKNLVFRRCKMRDTYGTPPERSTSSSSPTSSSVAISRA